MPPPDAAAGGPPPVSARGLTRRYGPLRALDGVDLTLAPGELLTIFGPNGAGKTTLLKILAGLVRPTSGALALFGLDPRAHADRVRRRVGLIGHAGYLYGGLTGRDNLLFYARLYDVPRPRERCSELIERVGLADRADDLVRTYSRGMQQRLSIVRGILHDPELVLLDEPYTGLDAQASRTLSGMLAQVRERRRCVVMVTHQLEEGLHLSTRIAILVHGRLVDEHEAAGLTREELERRYLRAVEGRAA